MRENGLARTALPSVRSAMLYNAQLWPPRTADEFVGSESPDDGRYEFAEGEIYRLASGTMAHSRLQANVARRFLSAIGGDSPCRVHLGGMRVRIGEFVYEPDLMVACGPVSHSAVEEGPCLAVEVTSPSTERIDRREKAMVYQRKESLQGYVIIAQDHRRVDLWTRASDGAWGMLTMRDNDAVTFPCAGVVMTLDEIYAGVVLPTPRQGLRLIYEALVGEHD